MFIFIKIFKNLNLNMHNAFFLIYMFEKLLSSAPAPTAQLVECPLRGTGGHGFDPGPRHTKVVWYHVNCLGHDTSVRQHYKSEH